MVRWELLKDGLAEDIWNKNLTKFSDCTIFQSFAWGEYKRLFGWKVYRWVAFDEKKEIVAMMQGLLRRYPVNFGLIWIPGGPVGNVLYWNNDMKQKIVETTGLNNIYFRLYSNKNYSIDDAQLLKKNGWLKTIYDLNAGLSMYYNPCKNDDQLLKECSTNWRHNLRRSQKYNLSIKQWINPDINEMLAIYNSMEMFKNIEQQYSRQELENILKQLGNSMVLYRCDDENGKLVGFRGCSIVADKGSELFAATSVQGRKMYASYALFWTLIRHCRTLGVQYYDMGGIDPQKNKGVYDFKKGTGAIPLEYLGEWEWASSEWLRWGVNFAIKYRSRRL